MFIQKRRSLYTSTATFSGAPDWIRTSGLPGRSRTLYPTELRTHIYENRPKTDFSYSVISGQIVVRLLQNRRTRWRKMALLCGFSAAPGGVSELSEPNALPSCGGQEPSCEGPPELRTQIQMPFRACGAGMPVLLSLVKEENKKWMPAFGHPLS